MAVGMLALAGCSDSPPAPKSAVTHTPLPVGGEDAMPATATPASPPTTMPIEPIRQVDAQLSLDVHRQLWDSQEPFEYAIEYSSKCFGRCTPEPTEVVIEDGRVSSYGGYHVVRMDSRIRRNLPFRTVDGLFDMLQYAINQNAYRMEVVYNAEAGYPETADIDYHAHGVDDEWSFEITGYLDLDRGSERFQIWTQFAKAVCDAWFDVTTDDPHGLIRALDTMRYSSPPEGLGQYRNWWVEALEGAPAISEEENLEEGIVEITAAHPLLYAVTTCDLPGR